jgi:hypothetical protein
LSAGKLASSVRQRLHWHTMWHPSSDNVLIGG